MNECYGKAAYGSWGAANAVSKRMEKNNHARRRRDEWEPMPVPFRCEQCGRWHLGNRFGLDTDGPPRSSKKLVKRRREDPIDID